MFSNFCKKASIQKEKRFFHEIKLFEMHSTANLPALTILKKKISFFLEKCIFSQKKVVLSEKSYYSSDFN